MAEKISSIFQKPLSATACWLSAQAVGATAIRERPASPFAWTGEMTLQQGIGMLNQGILQAVSALSGAIVHAAVGWFAVMPLAILLLFLALSLIMESAARKLKS